MFLFPSFQDGRKLGYGAMHGIPMVATSPVRHGVDSPHGGPPPGQVRRDEMSCLGLGLELTQILGIFAILTKH